MSELHWLRLGRVSPVSRRLEVRSERLSSERWAQQVENLPGSQEVEGCGTKRFQLPLWIKQNPCRTTLKPWEAIVCWLQGIIILSGFPKWCKMELVNPQHGRLPVGFTWLLRMVSPGYLLEGELEAHLCFLLVAFSAISLVFLGPMPRNGV